MKRIFILITSLLVVFFMTSAFAWADEDVTATETEQPETTVTTETPVTTEPAVTDEQDPTEAEEALAITDLAAVSASKTSIELSWNCNKDDITFSIYRSTSKSGSFKKIKTTKENTYKNTGLSAAKRYYYYVKAGDTKTDTVSAVPFYGPEVTTERSGSGTSIQWTEHPYATGYKVYRSYSSSGKWTRIKTVSKTVLSCKDTRVPSGKQAYYRVKPYCKTGKKTIYGHVSATIKAEKVYRVYIETGHGIGIDGKWDSGAKWNGDQEAKLMIPVAQSMTNYLRANGVYVYTDAFSGNNINLKKSVADAKTKKISAMVHLHCDAYFEPSGTLPLYKTKSQKKLAQYLDDGVHAVIADYPRRGLKYRKDLYGLRTSCGTVACIFETGSIKQDNELLKTRYDDMGKGLALGICNYLGIAFSEN